MHEVNPSGIWRVLQRCLGPLEVEEERLRELWAERERERDRGVGCCVYLLVVYQVSTILI